jgi:hypothetical protein
MPEKTALAGGNTCSKRKNKLKFRKKYIKKHLLGWRDQRPYRKSSRCRECADN